MTNAQRRRRFQPRLRPEPHHLRSAGRPQRALCVLSCRLPTRARPMRRRCPRSSDHLRHPQFPRCQYARHLHQPAKRPLATSLRCHVKYGCLTAPPAKPALRPKHQRQGSAPCRAKRPARGHRFPAGGAMRVPLPAVTPDPLWPGSTSRR